MRALLILLTVAALVAAPAGATTDPDALVRDTTDRVLEVLDDADERVRSDEAFLFELIEEIVLPHFDFEAMTRLAVGKHWRKLQAAQRDPLVREFRTLLVRTYGKALREYRDQTVVFLPMRGDASSGDVTVRSEIEQLGGFPIPVDYNLYLQDGAWKVYDVVIDGVSLVTNYRSSFSQKIRQDGVDGLIRQLEQRNNGSGS